MATADLVTYVGVRYTYKVTDTNTGLPVNDRSQPGRFLMYVGAAPRPRGHRSVLRCINEFTREVRRFERGIKT